VFRHGSNESLTFSVYEMYLSMISAIILSFSGGYWGGSTLGNSSLLGLRNDGIARILRAAFIARATLR